MEKAILTCALTGVLTNPKQHPVPVTAPEAKKSFIDKYGDALKATTGVALAGWALWGVLIVSEGTRIIPARNAIPIP